MTPAEQLKGLNLGNGWTVVEVAARRPNATGGHFSKGYIAQHEDGRKGFLKAMDYAKAFECPNSAEVLQSMTNAYMFEKSVCDKCAHLSKVARALDSGSVQTDAANTFTKVEYLIFELAQHDVRAHLDLQDGLDVVFLMKTLHNVATGISQLHRASIAHQDLKPSNVLIYKGVGSKICDLGRAWDRNQPAPHDALGVAGDCTYAPPEFMYGAVPNDERTRRFGCDLYHLGNLTVFLFTRVHVNALLIENLHFCHRPIAWGDSYAEVLPFVMASFDEALSTFASHVPDFLREELCTFVAELCNPDPDRRGQPLNRATNRFGLNRYISRFDRLSHLAALELIKGAKASV
ncbi:MAG: protein kinase domain-containing protein [Pirellulaceae bacterium]